jgi:2-keto-4-pentenoate hydratase/2-oxohepta-3-ene-1,7-dioic acid hydratase in catechol pathway
MHRTRWGKNVFSLCTFLYEREQTVGLVVEGMVNPLAELLPPSGVDGPTPTTMRELLAAWDTMLPACRGAARRSLSGEGPAGTPLSEAELLAPVPDAGKIVNVGLNYRDHAEEMGMELPGEGFRPNFFFKGDRHCLLAPGGPVPLSSETLDWEAELAVVIGTRCRNVAIARALDHVAGYTCHDDVTDRAAMMRPDGTLDFLGGKSRDGFAPLGPVILPREFVPDVNALRVRLSVNGEVMQDFACDGLLWGPAECVSYLSTIMTLEPGDIIALGTGAGVGWAKGIPTGPRTFPEVLAHFRSGGGRFLDRGDRVAVDIEPIGRLEHGVE